MGIEVGDHLLPGGDHDRSAVIIAIQGPDGAPPYVVRWLRDGHLALVTPGPYDRIMPGSPPQAAEGSVPGEEERP